MYSSVLVGSLGPKKLGNKCNGYNEYMGPDMMMKRQSDFAVSRAINGHGKGLCGSCRFECLPILFKYCVAF